MKIKKRYFEYECHAHHWIQILLSQYLQMCESNRVFSIVGYEHKNKNVDPYL